MSGLVAVISHDRREPVDPDDFEALVGRYTTLRRGQTVRRTAAATWAMAAYVGNDETGLAADINGWRIAAGTVHALKPLTTAAPDDLEGQFAIVRHRADDDVVEAFSDPFGMQQFYRAVRNGRTYLSTSATALAAHLGCPADPEGIKLYLRTGKQLGSITFWVGVTRFDPAEILTIGPSGRTTHVYWRPAVDPALGGLTLRRTTDLVTDVMLGVAERWLAPESFLWADLTGGYDSRLTNALLTRVDVPFRANTAGESETVDVRIAREVARAGGLDWQHERLPDDWELGRGQLDRAVGWADGTLDVLLLGEVLWRQHQRSRIASVVVNGGGGEHLGPAPWMQEFTKAGRSTRVDMDSFMRMRMLPPARPGVIREAVFPEIDHFCQTYSRAVLAKRAAPFRAELNTAQLDAMYVFRAISHFGAFRSAFNAHVRTELPFYFKDVFSAGFSANHKWRNGHRLHRGVIERLNGRIAAVPTERGGPAQPLRLSNIHRFGPYYTRLARVAVRKIRGIPAPASPMPVSQQTAYSTCVAALQRDGVFERSSMRTEPLYDHAALQSILAGCGDPAFDQWVQLGRIVTIEMTLRNTDAGL